MKLDTTKRRSREEKKAGRNAEEGLVKSYK